MKTHVRVKDFPTLKVSDLRVALSILYAAVALKVYMHVLIFFSTNTSLFQLLKQSLHLL